METTTTIDTVQQQLIQGGQRDSDRHYQHRIKSCKRENRILMKIAANLAANASAASSAPAAVTRY